MKQFELSLHARARKFAAGKNFVDLIIDNPKFKLDQNFIFRDATG